MREKIGVDRLEIGMYVESLDGRWIDHPFWRTKFVVRDEHMLAALRSSGIVECWIDPSKGASPPGDGASSPAGAFAAHLDEPSRASPPESSVDPARGRASGPAARVRYDEEVERAATVCVQAARVTRSLFRQARLGRALELDRCAAIAGQIAESATRHPAALVSLARVRTHHSYTFMHSVAVCALMTALARQLGFDDAATHEAALAGLLHDIGKAGVAREILDKPGRLTDEELAIVKKHPEIGHRMLRDNEATNAVVLLACLHHHERFDAGGYPHGLGGESIPHAARMNAVCDVYDAITSLRAYKQPWDPAESLARMAAWTRSGQFDPAVFRAFANTVGIYPVGSLVRMQSSRLALVVDVNPATPAQPCVKVFWSTKKSMPLRLERIDLASPGATDRIVGRESNAEWGFKHLPELLIGEQTYRRFASS